MRHGLGAGPVSTQRLDWPGSHGDYLRLTVDMHTPPRAEDQPPGPVPSPAWHRPELTAAAVVLLMTAAQIGWLALSRRPLEYDDAWYMEYALLFKRTLLAEGPQALLAQLRGAFGFKAPGVSLAAALAMAAAGEAPRVAAAVSLAAWLLSATYLLLLARRLLSPTAAAVASVLFASMPLSFSMGRALLVEASLALAVVAFLFHAASSEGLRRPVHVAALVLWGAMGLLVKVSFPAYVVVAALALSALPRVAGRGAWARWSATWAGVALAASGLAGWAWYADNWRTVLEYTRSVSGGALAAQYAVPVRDYLVAFVLHAISPWNLLAGAALALTLAAKRVAGVRWTTIGLALAWILPPALVLGSSSARYIRYLAPVLPGIALGLAALAEPWLGGARRRALLVAGMLTAPPVAYFVVGTLPSPLSSEVRGWVTAPWLGANVTSHEAPPDRRPWPNAEIVAAAQRAAGPGPVVLRLNVDLPELNHNNLKVEALLQRVEVIPAQIDQGSPERALATAFDGDLLLVQVGGVVAADFLNVQRDLVAREAASGRQPYREVARFELPDARTVALLERRCEASADGPAEVPLATLARGLELVALEVARPAPGLATVRTRYRVASGSHPALAAVIELVDATGRSLGSGEHPLCRRPRGPWPAGALVEDTFFLPGWALTPGVRLRLGLRDLLTGASIPVERAAPGLAVAGGRLDVGRLGDRIATGAGR